MICYWKNNNKIKLWLFIDIYTYIYINSYNPYNLLVVKTFIKYFLIIYVFIGIVLFIITDKIAIIAIKKNNYNILPATGTYSPNLYVSN